MDKTFQWTDELAKEYAEQHRFSSSRISIGAFKESKIKEPERIAVEILQTEIAGTTYNMINSSKIIPEEKFPAIKQAIENVLNEKDKFDGGEMKACVMDEAGQWSGLVKEPETIGEYLKKQQRWVDEFMIGLWEQDIRLSNQSASLQVLLPNILQVIKSLKEEWNKKKYSEKDVEDCFNESRKEGLISRMYKYSSFQNYLRSINK